MNAERASGRWAGAIGVAVVLSLASASAAQSGRQTPAPWRTPPGGDASGDYVGVRYIEDVGELRGTRRVERVDVRDGYTTGSSVIVVLAGAEPEPSRSFRVHLPYGASLDLAAGDVVEVDARSRRLGLGTAQEIVVTRGGELVLLTTSRGEVAGIRVARGAEVPRRGSQRRWSLRVRIGASEVEVAPDALVWVRPASLLLSGLDVAYEGVRPPDAFDSRVLTAVRIRAPR